MSMIDNTYLNYTHGLIDIQSTKRRRSFNEIAVNSQEINKSKRTQHLKIHSELHTYTIETMMNSQRLLQESERLQKVYQIDDNDNDNEEVVETQSQSNFTQSPFWPVINKVKTN